MAKIKSHIKCFSFQLLVVSAILFSFIQNSFGEDIQIKGTVYDGATYEPLAGAKVELLSNRASATSDNTGQFTISTSTSIRNMNSQFISALNTQIHGTILSFTIPGEKPMSLSIHATDFSGRNVSLFVGTASAGNHTLNLADKLRAAGVYVLNISLNEVRNFRTRLIAINGIFSAVDIVEKNGTSTKTAVRAATSAQDTLAVSKTGYQTRKVALKIPPKEALKIRLSANESSKYHHPAVLLEEYTYEKADFPQIHASSIEDLPNGDLVCVYFGGPGEKKIGTVIRFQRKPLGGKWSAPIVLGDDKSAGKRAPCWNPVIYQVPEGELLFWWKVGPSPSRWWGMLKRSTDNGKTWSDEIKLGGPNNPDILGPVKNKPKMLNNGTILAGSSRENEGWVTHVELSKDKGKTWTWKTKIGMGEVRSAIQPTIMEFEDGLIKMLMRTRSKNVGMTTSKDYGLTWTPIEKTNLPHNGAGLDAVTLKDGRQLLVYNHCTGGRSHLNVSVSEDGELWKAAVRLESPNKDNGEKSYPAVIQSSDGLVHITYTYKRQRPKHVVINPDAIKDPVPMPDGKWPTSGPASIAP